MEMESTLFPDIRYVMINEVGELKRDGENIKESERSIDMARLDMSLFVTGQVKVSSLLIE